MADGCVAGLAAEKYGLKDLKRTLKMMGGVMEKPVLGERKKMKDTRRLGKCLHDTWRWRGTFWSKVTDGAVGELLRMAEAQMEVVLGTTSKEAREKVWASDDVWGCRMCTGLAQWIII